jgi:hypothetical protein
MLFNVKKHEKDRIHNKFTEFSFQHQIHLCLCEVHIVQQFHKLNKQTNFSIIEVNKLIKTKISHEIVKWNEMKIENSQTNNSKCPNIWFLAVISVCNWFRSHPTNWTNSTLCLNYTKKNIIIFCYFSLDFNSFIQIKDIYFSFICFLKNSWHSKILNIKINSTKLNLCRLSISICFTCSIKWKMTQKNEMNQMKWKRKYRNFGISTSCE